jgi:hypothetical protein
VIITDGGILFLLASDGRLVARSVATGEITWSLTLPLARAILPMDGAIVTTGQMIAKIDERHGTIEWEHSNPGDSFDEPALLRNRLVLGHTAGGGSISKSTWLLDFTSGRIIEDIASSTPGLYVEPLAITGHDLLTYYTSGTNDLEQLEPGYLAARLQRNELGSGRLIEHDDLAPDARTHGPDTPPAGRIFASDEMVALEVAGTTYVYDLRQSLTKQKPISLPSLGRLLGVLGRQLLFLSDTSLSLVSIRNGTVQIHPLISSLTRGHVDRMISPASILIKDHDDIIYYSLMANTSLVFGKPPCRNLLNVAESPRMLNVQCSVHDGSSLIYSYNQT